MNEVRGNNNEAVFILILVTLCLLLFFFRLGARPLWDVDEGMHATTSKEMIISGDWITTTFNGENFYDKPILHNWFISLSFLIFGFTEFAARLPAAILGLGGVIITYLLGRSMFGPRAGLLAGAVLATNAEYALLSRMVLHDMSLTFFMTTALFLFYAGFQDEGRRKRHFLLGFAALGFAVLAKGPVGVLLPALIIGLFLMWQRRAGFLREMQLGPGIVIFLAVAAPWYILISLKNRDYGWYFFVHNNLMRFLSGRALHHQPFYYYIPALLGGFFPWSCFLPLSILQVFRRPLKEKDQRFLFLFLWFTVVFLFFSAASSKLSTYILPLFPAAALFVGSLWDDLIEALTPGLRKGFLYCFVPLFMIPPLVLLYFWIHPSTYYATKHGINFLAYSYVLFWIGGGALLSFCLAMGKRLRVSFWILAGTVISVFLFVEWSILPTLNATLGTKQLSLKLDRIVPPGEKLVFIKDLQDTALFYTNRRARVLKTPGEVIGFLGSEKRVFCIVEKRLYEQLDEVRKRSYVIEEDGGKLIISNQK